MPQGLGITSLARRRKQRMFVVVTEDHHDVLPWLHAAMRRKVLPLEGWRLVHVDAHPDLGALKDAAIITKPRELYAFLDDSEYGICEWILPLAYRGHCGAVDWVKPPFAAQFREGSYAFAVGADASGALKVDCDEAYFKEDGATAAGPLEGARPLALAVVAADAIAAAPPAGAWVLDVCLDYFACRDPFAGAPPGGRLCDPLPAGGAATADEAAAAVAALEAALAPTAARPPALVTIARSTLDGYCPADLVEGLEAAVVAAVGRLYGACVVVRDLEGTKAFDAAEVARAFPQTPARKRPRHVT